jgi:septum formation protein
MDCELILGSKSPRRHELLKLLNVPFRVLTAETHEHFDPDWTPEIIVTELALRKGREIKEIYNAEIERATLLCADTIVVIDGQILNKPQSKSEAAGMLGRLQGRTHSVFTGFSILTPSKEICDFEETRVTFSEMSPSEIEHYIDVAQPYDKAGSYGIQDDVGACFIEKINGCYYNVVGLPVAKLYKTFKSLNLI